MEKCSQEFTPSPDNFDSWLTSIDDQELLRLSQITDQAFAEKVDDEAGMAQVIDLAMRFSGQESDDFGVIYHTFNLFSIQLAAERMVREGNATREGNYTLAPDGQGPHFSLTEKGRRERDKE